MEDFKRKLAELEELWKGSQPDRTGGARTAVKPEAFTKVILAAYRVVVQGSTMTDLGALRGVDGPKRYVVFEKTLSGRRRESRPFRKNWLVSSESALKAAWEGLISSLNSRTCKVDGLNEEQVNKVVYAATHYLACAFDLHSDNRATAGKFFERITASLILQLCNGTLAQLPVLKEPPDYVVPVDVVVRRAGRPDFLILASKITSRERIVQPFVHDFMVKKCHGTLYRTMILVGSETNRLQRDPGLQETCVAGTIEAYRQTLGGVDGIYYLDLPRAYAEAAFAKSIEVSTIGALLCGRLSKLYGLTRKQS